MRCASRRAHGARAACQHGCAADAAAAALALRSEPEEAAPEVDTTAVEARSRALAASKLSVAAVVASAVRSPVAGGAAARLVAGAGLVAAAPLAATAFATLADGDATRPLRAALAAAHASAVYAACRAAGGLTRGVLVATHAYALLVAAWPFDGPAAAWSESTRPELDRQWAAIALALASGAGYWLYANATPLVLALAPWAVVGAAAAATRASCARAVAARSDAFSSAQAAQKRARRRLCRVCNEAPSRSWRAR